MFAALTRKAKVDVPLSNHPIVDQTFAKLEQLRQRQPGGENPFVRGGRANAPCYSPAPNAQKRSSVR